MSPIITHRTVQITLLSIFLLLSMLTGAFVPRTVRGYVYINNLVTKPDAVILSISGESINATLFDDGYYIIDFSAEDGETGTFTVVVNGENYLADETITTESGVYVYDIDLHVWVPENHPPNKPSNPSPSDGSTDVDIDVTLSWQCSDPDGDTLTYDVYFGKTSPPPKVSSNQSSTSFNPGTLQYSTTYYWRVVAWDTKGACNGSEIWTFTTEAEPVTNNPPCAPYDPNPSDNATNVSIHTKLSWKCSDPDNDTLTYDVYFGTSSNPPKVSSNQSSTSFDPGDLEYSTVYYWRVVAWDEHGLSSTSPVWMFVTEEKPNVLPTVTLMRPIDAIYFRDKEILSFSFPVIVGHIMIQANATDPDGSIKEVKFQIDGITRYTDTEEPFSWIWDERTFGFHVIGVIAYDDQGGYAQLRKEVFILNFGIL